MPTNILKQNNEIEIDENKYFVFMDESGNNDKDQYFVLGLLFIPAKYIGDIFNTLESISDKIKDISYQNKIKILNEYKNKNDWDTVFRYAQSEKRFEMKFQSINKDNQDLYIHILKKYFTLKDVKFSALVIDKKDTNYKPDNMTHWNRYINNATMLFINNLKNIKEGKFVLIADQLSQPKSAKIYEDYMNEQILKKIKEKGINKDRFFGVIRLESHSSVFLQLCDILVGAIGYDLSGNTNERKVKFIQTLKDILQIESLSNNQTINNPNYFSIWRYNNKE